MDDNEKVNVQEIKKEIAERDATLIMNIKVSISHKDGIVQAFMEPLGIVIKANTMRQIRGHISDTLDFFMKSATQQQIRAYLEFHDIDYTWEDNSQKSLGDLGLHEPIRSE